MKRVGFIVITSILLSVAVVRAAGQSVRYELIEGSMLVDECLPCGRPPLQLVLRGSLTLKTVDENPILSRYIVESFDFAAGSSGVDYRIAGDGSFEIGGEVALRQQMALVGQIKSPSQNGVAGFANDDVGVSRLWPMIAITLIQTNGTLGSTITLKLAAAPIREIWFSTTSSFHSANLPPDNNEISSGSILSSSGRTVKTNRQLIEHFINDATNNFGLDGFDILPGGEIAFSTETAAPFGDGAVAFANAASVLPFAEILRPLAPTIVNDPGLDALHFVSDTKFYFSIKQDVVIFQDPGPNIVLKNGDILWTETATQQGGAFKSNFELLARFNPPPTFAPVDYGLDALYVWPSGEIWFSIRDGFQDLTLGPVGGGDILSDQGYIVFRNLELVSAFAPIEDASNFGLDALYIVSDAVVTTADARLTILRSPNGGADLFWKTNGRVFQVEACEDVASAFNVISAITPDASFSDTNVKELKARFFRVRQW